ncbi:MAG: RHS repeat-associated core domain-containing protein [Bacteroidota bacterium]
MNNNNNCERIKKENTYSLSTEYYLRDYLGRELAIYDYFGARYYNNKLGVWLQVDPLSEKNPNESPFAYAYCNPLRYFDPDGNNGWDFLKGVAVGFGKHMLSAVSSIAKMVSEGTTGGLNPRSNLERAMALQSVVENPSQITDALQSKFEQLTTDFGTSKPSGEVVGEILGVAAEVAAAKKVNTFGSKSFFDGAKYTEKVTTQMEIGDLHSFPEVVKNFERYGKVSKIKGADNKIRQMLTIKGTYQNRKGQFEFIKDEEGNINHRFFRPEEE